MFECSKWTERRDWNLTTVKQLSLISLFRNTVRQRRVEHGLQRWSLEDYSDQFPFHKWHWITVRTSRKRSIFLASTNYEPPQEQTPGEAMDTERDIIVKTPSQRNEIKMEVDDTTDVAGSNTRGYIQPVGPQLLRQPSCHRKQAPRNLFPRIQWKSHGFSDAYEDDHVNSSYGHGREGACIDGDWVICPCLVSSDLELSAPVWYKGSRDGVSQFFSLQSDSEANWLITSSLLYNTE